MADNQPHDRTADDTTLEELFETVAPPRKGTTGAHVVACNRKEGQAYLLVVQGPEAPVLMNRILDFVEAVYDKTEHPDYGDSGS